MEKDPSNMQELQRGVYIVRTQAGFRKALKRYRKYYEIEDKSAYGFPTEYPSLVLLSHSDINGDFKVQCKSLSHTWLKEILNSMEKKS